MAVYYSTFREKLPVTVSFHELVYEMLTLTVSSISSVIVVPAAGVNTADEVTSSVLPSEYLAMTVAPE